MEAVRELQEALGAEVRVGCAGKYLGVAVTLHTEMNLFIAGVQTSFPLQRVFLFLFFPCSTPKFCSKADN